MCSLETPAAIELGRLRADAAARLDPVADAYIGGGAGDSPDANVAAWQRHRLRPRVLRDVTNVSTKLRLLGQTASCPVMIAPTAMHRLACGDGELATARAAAGAGVIYVVSAAATTSIEDISEAAPGAVRWMQAYMMRDRGLTRVMLERAARSGCSAVVLTVDAPGLPHNARHLARPLNYGYRLPNLLPDEEAPDVLAAASNYATDLTFGELAQVRAWTGMPLVVKGVLRGDDAVLCLEAGADAVVVSNHGGRQVPGCVPTAVALEDVVDAVAGRADVYVDGGIRSGADVLRALSLGAKAVMVGRPVLWGLAIGGQEGASAVIAAFRTELERQMALCGLVDVADVPRSLVFSSTGSPVL